MLSWDEVDNEDTGAAVIKGANAGHASVAGAWARAVAAPAL